VLLTDFGLARAADDASLTQSGVIAGTPQYMSPEQARGDNVDHRTDLFSLGTVLYTLLAGHPPFRAESAMGVLRRVCDDAPRPLPESNPIVPLWLDALIARLHAKQPADRFESAAEVAELLKGCLAHVQQPTLVPLPEQVTRLVRQNRRSPKRMPRWAWFAVACCVVAALGLGLTASVRKPGAHEDLNSGKSPSVASTKAPAIDANVAFRSAKESSLTDGVQWNDDHQDQTSAIRTAIDRLEEETADDF
jgi:serine/threonine-protein kinase